MTAPQKSETPVAAGEIANQNTAAQVTIVALQVPDSNGRRKALSTAAASCALLGIQAVSSCDDRGHRTLILTREAWTKEVRLEDLAAALAELKAVSA